MAITKNQWAVIILRIGLAFVFLYAAIVSLLIPSNYIGYVPVFLLNLFGNRILYIISIYEIILGIWLISGYRVFFSAVFSAMTILGITVFNIGAADILFRNVAIFCAAVGLAFLTYKVKDVEIGKITNIKK